jgi:hypothetical protein
MVNKNNIDEVIVSLEKEIAIHKFVKEKVPGVYIQTLKKKGSKGFVSKHINKNYSGLEFVSNSHKISVMPYLELDFEYNNLSEKIRVYSVPRRNRLAYMRYDYLRKKSFISFSRLSINMKNNNFRDEILNECRIKILNFIKQNPKAELDQKHLDPKLKKLLAFT